MTRRVYNLANMNAAQDALLRATRLMALVDATNNPLEQSAFERAIEAELNLMQRMLELRREPQSD